MAEGADSGPANPGKRRPPAGRKSRQSRSKKPCTRVSLEKVLGISTASSSGLTSDPKSGLIAYPAGCVIVLLHPKKNQQSHIINASRKPFSALAFSHDGKHLVTGESGHMPCVRVWELGGGQVAEVQSHKYGVSCVAFSTNSCYIVSVGFQHDMTVSVWDWRKGVVIASNKVSSRVLSVSVSQDDSYFVTAGHRHVKFWYLDASKERRVTGTVPLIGRSGLLGDHKNSVFSGVACGRGLMASSTYCITSAGLLCLFNSSRHLEAWVNLKTSSASCVAVSEDFIFCGCADGAVRVFGPSHLQYITTLQRPHRLGVDLTQSSESPPAGPAARFPDSVAVTFDPAARLLTSVYNDHSVYVWDVRDVRSAAKLYSALYHSSCVWSVEVCPEQADGSPALPPSSFLTCSSDNTVRLWTTDPTGPGNLYSSDLQRILYVGENTQHLQAEGEAAAGADGKSGVRVLSISPDGRHLAAGDRCGNLRIFGLEFLDELVKIEAHDSEVLCLEFSPTSTGVNLLASASRDRLIHVFNLDKNYSLQQTLNDHSASITAVKFTGESPEVRMVSCGADKSIYFQEAEQTVDGPWFSRSHHVVEKTTLYDMDLDSSRTHVSVACQDRNVRVYNVETGKLTRCLKGSTSDEGALLKVHMDPSGSYLATSCSDKNITIFDYESGECVASLFGHAEIVTCMRFSQDCRHLITVSGDSCVFVWRLDSHMTSSMRKRRGLKPSADRLKHQSIRRETFITGPSSQLPQTEEDEEEEADLGTPARLHSAQDARLLQTNGKLPMWFRKLGEGGASSAVQSAAEPRQVRSRWAEQLNPLTICSNASPSPTKSQEEEELREEEEEDEEGDFHPQSLESLLVDEEEEEEEEEVLQDPGDSSSDLLGSAPPIRGPEVRGQGAEPVWSARLSPDSACYEGSAGSLEQQDADTDSLSQGSSVSSLLLEDDEDRNSLKEHFDTLTSSLERFDTDLSALQPPEEKRYLNPRLSISTRFLSRFQDRIRSRAPPPASIPTRILEESNVSNTTVNSECSSVSSAQPHKEENNNNNSRAPCRTAGLQEAGPGLGYLGASSRAEPRPEEEHLSSALRPAARPRTGRDGPEPCEATPTKVMSQGGVRRFSSTEKTPTNQNLAFNPASFLTATPTTSDVIGCSAFVQEEEPQGPETRIQTDPGSAPPSSYSSPLSEKPRPPQTGNFLSAGDGDDGDEEASLQQCQQVANELRQAARRAVHLYRQLGVAAQGAERRVQRSAVLQGALDAVHCELQAVLREGGAAAHLGDHGAAAHLGDHGAAAHLGDHGAAAHLGDHGAAALLGDHGAAAHLGDHGAAAHLGDHGAAAHLGDHGAAAHLGDHGAAALLERYSELLVQMTRDKLDRV
ncbi:WD repeat-containing protein 62 [Clinocottus analis]|uniref:WD repeat-containing protein 62 n=1 Tax=Clinocottus analis TaxID=304258 RepID=UPI0035C18E96